MIIKRQRLYSGYEESNGYGLSYMPAQVMTDYALNPVEDSVKYLETTRVGEIKPVKKKLNLVKGLVSPLKKIIGKRKADNNLGDAKNKN